MAWQIKNLPANTGDAGLIPGSGRSPGGGNGNPLQYSCLENPMDKRSLLLLLLLSCFSRVRLCATPRRQPTRLPRPWDSPGKDTGVGCHFLLQCMKVKCESEVAESGLTLSDPMDCSPPGSSIRQQSIRLQLSIEPWALLAILLDMTIARYFSSRHVRM